MASGPILLMESEYMYFGIILSCANLLFLMVFRCQLQYPVILVIRHVNYYVKEQLLDSCA